MSPSDPAVQKLQRRLLNVQGKIGDFNPAVTRRLKELVLIEWPRLQGIDELRRRLQAVGVPFQRATISGKAMLLYYDSVTTRE
jgi:hypothetical protein